MGKGDIKTRRGKISNGSYGVRRPRRVYRYVDEVEVEEKPKAKKTAEPKEEKPKAKKTTAKEKGESTAKTSTKKKEE